MDQFSPELFATADTGAIASVFVVEASDVQKSVAVVGDVSVASRQKTSEGSSRRSKKRIVDVVASAADGGEDARHFGGRAGSDDFVANVDRSKVVVVSNLRKKRDFLTFLSVSETGVKIVSTGLLRSQNFCF